MKAQKKDNIIDWTDRKEAMDTYREYEKYSMTGPNYRYYNGKLQPVAPPLLLTPEPVAYKAEPNEKGKQAPNNLK